MKLGNACFGSIFAIIKPINSDSKFAIVFGLSIDSDFLFTLVASHFHSSTFEMFLAV